MRTAPSFVGTIIIVGFQACVLLVLLCVLRSNHSRKGFRSHPKVHPSYSPMWWIKWVAAVLVTYVGDTVVYDGLASMYSDIAKWMFNAPKGFGSEAPAIIVTSTIVLVIYSVVVGSFGIFATLHDSRKFQLVGWLILASVWFWSASLLGAIQTGGVTLR